MTEFQARALQLHREQGNDSAHGLEAPSQEELGFALDVVEHLLRSTFVLKVKSEALSELRARRKASLKGSRGD